MSKRVVTISKGILKILVIGIYLIAAGIFDIVFNSGYKLFLYYINMYDAPYGQLLQRFIIACCFVALGVLLVVKSGAHSSKYAKKHESKK